MIASFAHKGLEKFFRTGSVAGIQANHAKKLRAILLRLNQMSVIEDVNFPGLHLHPLRGDLKGFWSLRVSGNWRVIFKFDGEDVSRVDYVDYH
jgi:proteic killer suppression protein